MAGIAITNLERPWAALYRAAVFEPDDRMILGRVADAEKAIVARTRELFHSKEAHHERLALDGALDGLRALRAVASSRRMLHNHTTTRPDPCLRQKRLTASAALRQILFN